MTRNVSIARAVRRALLMSAVVAGGAAGTPAFAQDQEATQTVVVTGSRIQNQDYQSNSPLTTVSGDAILANQDVTLDTFLNTLPQVNPAGTTTSNNPSNNGQSNVDLRGLGANRNLVLIDGRRAMPSASDLSVDLNIIPQSMIENLEIITGGAGAVYGADAVAGVVNMKLKSNFEGFQLSGGYSDSSEEWDSREYNASATMGANFADDRGNAVISFEYANREQLIKSQREFAQVATATTTFLPEGLYFPTGNAPTQAAVDAYFAPYGAAPASVGRGNALIGFNNDGTLFSRGSFNSPVDVLNFRYPNDLAVNSDLFPDVYSYNFDAVNVLVSPLERRSMFAKFDFDVSENIQLFSHFGYTNYNADIALAPTPIPTVTIAAPGETLSAGEAISPFIPTRAQTGLTARRTIANQLIIPVTNPFIPADFRALLATRDGNNPALIDQLGGSPNEPFLMRQRTLDAGLRGSGFDNTVTQYLLGLRGKLSGDWAWEGYASEGRTVIDQFQSGNIDTQKLLDMLAAPDGGVSTCEGGFNPFGRQAISDDCLEYLEVSNTLTYEFKQQIVQAYVTGPVAELPAGDLSTVLGAEYRTFRYSLDPGAAGGPISGFNVQDRAQATTTFEDIFTELFIPIVKDAAGAQAIDLTLGYRYSTNQFKNVSTGIEGDEQNDSAYKAELSWLPIDQLRFRASYQRAVRAPNFNELFDGGGSNPQYVDPCAADSASRAGPNGAQLLALCRTAGQLGAAGWGGDSFIPTPGTQVALTLGPNVQLSPEKADTITLGVVWQPEEGVLSRLRTSVDYYNIEVKDALVQPDSNLYIADCYNLYGNNPGYDPNYINCRGIFRSTDIPVPERWPDRDRRYRRSAELAGHGHWPGHAHGDRPGQLSPELEAAGDIGSADAGLRGHHHVLRRG
jgi:iron complex outermembrane receptor protein